MKKIVITAALLAASFQSLAFSTGATTNWVAQYVREYVSNAISNSAGEVTANTKTVTNGEVTTVTTGTADFPIVLTITNPSVAALIAADCDASVATYGITNGTLWAWNSTTDRYERKNRNPIVPTQTNFVWNTIGSVSDNGRIAFKQEGDLLFTVSGTFLTKEQAKEVRGN